MILKREEIEITKKKVKDEYGRYREQFRKASEEYEVLFKEWERTGDEETCKKVDEAYEKLQKARENRNLLAVIWLERLIDDGII